MARYEELGFSLHHVTPMWDYLPHTHDFAELEIIVGGTAVNSINGRSFSVRAGDAFVVGKGATHEISQVDGLELYNIGFNGQALRGIGQDLLEMPEFHALFLIEEKAVAGVRRLRLSEDELRRARRILEAMMAEHTAAQPGFRTALTSGFALLLLLLSRNYVPERAQQDPWQAAFAAAYMERHFSEPVSMAALAESVYLSERHFRRMFEQAYQTSPSEYLGNLRLTAAARMLRGSGRPVTEVALACGFSDGNYFARVFRRRFSVPPTKYREMAMKKDQ